MILQVLVRGQLLQLVVFGAVLSSICRAQSPTTSAASEALIVSPPVRPTEIGAAWRPLSPRPDIDDASARPQLD